MLRQALYKASQKYRMPKKSLIGDVIIELTEIDSTNNYAMRLLNEGMADDGVVIRADVQHAGRGQHGNVWQAEESKNLLMSAILSAEGLSLSNQFILNAATCVALADMLMGQYNLPHIQIKWPNDVYAGTRKMAGILIENQIRGHHWTHAIIGIGLNINQTRFKELTRATSMALESGRGFKVNQVLKSLLKNLNLYFAMQRKQPAEVLRLYNQMLMGQGSRITFTHKHELKEGQLLGVDSQGVLQVEVEGKLRKFQHKEIELAF